MPTIMERLILFLFTDPVGLLLLAGIVLGLYLVGANWRSLMFILKSLSRNKIRTALSVIATFFLVLVVTAVWTILYKLDQMTTEQSKDLKVMVTEKWQARSQMPLTYAKPLASGAAKRPDDVKPQDDMAWSFYLGSLDPGKLTPESIVFFFCMNPDKFPTMMDDVDQFTPAQRADLDRNIELMKRDKRKVIIGVKRLEAIHKKVGERFKLTCQNFKDVDLEFEVCGTLPEGRYANAGVMNIDYLQDALDQYAREHKGTAHPQADKVLMFEFLKTEDTASFQRLAEQITSSGLFTSPPVKVETASSGVASFMDAYRDLLWAMRWLLAPAILVTISLVISNAISISVRERRAEMAVLKVLGFTPMRILFLVIGEAVLVGAVSGFASSGLAYWLINSDYNPMGGIPFQIGWMQAFRIPIDALWWGPAVGGGAAFFGSILPALAARNVKVSEVFSKIA
jgi:putative ABC transport system permease protein